MIGWIRRTRDRWRRRWSACASVAFAGLTIGAVLAQQPEPGLLERIQEKLAERQAKQKQESSRPRVHFKGINTGTTVISEKVIDQQVISSEPVPTTRPRLLDRARSRLFEIRRRSAEVPIYDSLRPRIGVLDQPVETSNHQQATVAPAASFVEEIEAAEPTPVPTSKQPTVRLILDGYNVLNLTPTSADEAPESAPALLPEPTIQPIPATIAAEEEPVMPVNLSAGEPPMISGPALHDQIVPAATGIPETYVEQAAAPYPYGIVPATISPEPAAVGQLMPVGCAGCAAGTNSGMIKPNIASGPPFGGMSVGGCSSCGAGACAGIPPCYPCEAKTIFGKFFHGVYQCICCPDPCYDPRWLPIGDASFFTDSPRPVTQTRLRWDAGFDLILPDRSEYFWARSDGLGFGPNPTVPFRGPRKLDYHDLSIYSETASSMFSFFIVTPYRVVEPETISRAAGFGDIELGTKTLLYDCELFQVAMIMRTYILSGNFKRGLGAGHVSIEPEILLGLRLGPETYLQSTISEWIPFGQPGYSGAVLRFNASLNHVIYRLYPNVPLVGTWELQSWAFQNGSYTDPILGSYQQSSGEVYVNIGPGLRLFLCDKIDIGIGTSFSLTERHWAEQLFRSEFRYRF